MTFAKKPDTREMAKLYLEDGLSYRQIGEIYGIIRQAVHQRFVRAGIERRLLKHQKIDKQSLERLYLVERISLHKIAERLQVGLKVIKAALKFHKIPKRSPVKFGGIYADFLRSLKIGKSKKIKLDIKNPHSRLHRSAGAIGINISMRSLGRENKFEVTRIE